jgi:uncharacterized lipoprotein YehR (DUF1307 family)
MKIKFLAFTLLLSLAGCKDSITETYDFTGYQYTDKEVLISMVGNGDAIYRINEGAERILNANCLRDGFLKENVTSKNKIGEVSYSQDFERVTSFKAKVIKGVARVNVSFYKDLGRNVKHEVSKVFTDVFLICLKHQMTEE